MRISIIIPVYNVAPWIRACLQSVVATVENLRRVERGEHVEIVCVDDGSTDGTGALLEEYVSQQVREAASPQVQGPRVEGLRFVVVHQENRGVAAARNRGLELASGDWVAFVDADDVLRDGALAEWVRLIRENPEADIVSLGMSTFTEDEGIDWKPTDAFDLRNDFCRPFFLSCYRRNLVGRTRFPQLTIGEDGVFWGRVYGKCRKLVTSDYVGYAYRLRGSSASLSKRTMRKAWDDVRHYYLRAFCVWMKPWRYPLCIHRQVLGWVTKGAYRKLRCGLARNGRVADLPSDAKGAGK